MSKEFRFPEFTPTELFGKIYQSSRNYEGEHVLHGGMTLDDKPKAIRYRVKVIQQFIDELERRADALEEDQHE